ncbi:hypothetical protein DSO57_1034097 [Entomophthora muscae]|uniref:Uncharacterized protein n=1 Tax=Entomophthora muscae TaxID=34485 RepID=A0ACC2SCV8_9FUNG|nr:hypothetical protein DSO57_1034097 [Entomophthora muscae]
MLVHLIKFVAFTLDPVVLMIWSTSLDLWTQITHFFHYVGTNPSQFMHILEDIPRQAQEILATSKNVVRSLTCDNLEFPTHEPNLSVPPNLTPPIPPFFEAPVVLASEESEAVQESAPKCASWLLGGMILMGLDSFFPQLSNVSSLWMPLQAAIPVLHWMVSWWILSPGWEPNLVSLAPLSHSWLPSRCIFKQDLKSCQLRPKPQKIK